MHGPSAEDGRPARAGIALDRARTRRARARAAAVSGRPRAAPRGRRGGALGRGAAGRGAAARPVRGAARPRARSTPCIATPARSGGPAQHLSRRLVVRLASAGAPCDRRGRRRGRHGSSTTGSEQIDAWIAAGVLDGPRAQRRRLPDRAEHRAACSASPISRRSSSAIRRRRSRGESSPTALGAIGPVLPAEWLRGDTAVDRRLAPWLTPRLHAAARRRARARRRSDPRDRLRRDPARRASSPAGWSSCRRSTARARRPPPAARRRCSSTCSPAPTPCRPRC